MLKRFNTKGILEAGCDEAGRGCLAGPVVAAAVILNPKIRIDGLDDSKKLTEAMREELYDVIMERALAVGVGVLEADRIDELNILRASLWALGSLAAGLGGGRRR